MKSAIAKVASFEVSQEGSAGEKARVTADSKMQCSDVDLSVCKVGVSVLEDLLEGC